ncbi:MAG: RluA family pseudouridine synthase [Myxococcales bacterium]|nr:MAG: RluA family pseudouridine synthase [Myxococcales bacterium]
MAFDEPTLLVVSPEQADERLDVFLAAAAGVSRNQIQRQIEAGLVRLNGKPPAKAGVKLRAGDQVLWAEPEAEEWELLAEDIPLSVVYEDSDLIVVDKPAGMVVHPAVGNPRGTLANALLFHCRDLAGIGGVLRPGIVHRIDKDTSGLLVVAKNDLAHHGLAEQFAAHSIERTYRSFVFGRPPAQTGTVDRPLARHRTDRKKYAVVDEGGKRAVTHWRIEADYGDICLLECRLETGRTHQIRVHMLSLGCPVIGDPVYGQPKRLSHLHDKILHDRLAVMSRQLLHAATLGFIHPRSGERLSFASPLPADMAGLKAWLDERAGK